jgi:PAS domain S-box-containing protein
MNLPAGLTTALDAVTEILNQRLRQLGQGKATVDERAHAEDLAVALEELNVVSEELSAQLRRAEDERERSAFLFDAAPYAFFITDLDGNIAEANRAAVALLSVLPHRLMGKPLIAYVEKDQRARLREKLVELKSSASDTWYQHDAVLQPREGAPVPTKLHLRVMPYAARRGQIFWVVRPLDAA